MYPIHWRKVGSFGIGLASVRGRPLRSTDAARFSGPVDGVCDTAHPERRPPARPLSRKAATNGVPEAYAPPDCAKSLGADAPFSRAVLTFPAFTLRCGQRWLMPLVPAA